MIRDPVARSEIAQQWTVVRRFCSGSHRQSQVPGGPFMIETPPESFYNLPFLLAFATLDQVLTELIAQGTIQCQRKFPPFGVKMAAAANILPWQNYALIESLKNVRNDLAHEARLLDKGACFAFIDAIESELKAWRVL